MQFITYLSQLEKKNMNNIVNGKREGIWMIYHENGKLCYKGEYNNGKQVGYWETYQPHGQLNSRGKFKYVLSTELRTKPRGFPDKWSLKWTKTGRLHPLSTIKLDRGEKICSFKEGLWIYYADNGTTHSVGDYKYNSKDGKWIYYYNNGTYEVVEYKEGIQVGPGKRYKPDGTEDK